MYVIVQNNGYIDKIYININIANHNNVKEYTWKYFYVQ